MESVKARLKRLEKINQPPLIYPFVVLQAEGQCPEGAIAQALGELPYKSDWQFILAPALLTIEGWQQKYSPGADTD